MNILMFTDYFHPHVEGGVEHAVYEVSRRLVALGHVVHIITLNVAHVARQELLDGIVIHRVGAVELTALTRTQMAFSAGALPRAIELVRELQPDIIHAHNLFFSTAPEAAALKFLINRPLVTTMQLGALDHLGGVRQLAARAYEQSLGRLILACSDRVIAVSQAVARHAASLGCRAEALRVVPNGVDCDKFRPSAPEAARARRPRVAVVGRLIFNKGPQYVVDAAPKILARFPEVEFLVVGDGPMRKMLRETIEQRGISAAFRFLGVRTDVADLLRTATLLVRPSLSEGLPLTVLEAMATGLPVVATPVGGTAEVVRDGQTGYLVAPESSNELADAVCRLLAEPETAAMMGSAGRTLVGQTYDWNQITQQTVALYHDAIGTWSARQTSTARALACRFSARACPPRRVVSVEFGKGGSRERAG